MLVKNYGRPDETLVSINRTISIDQKKGYLTCLVRTGDLEIYSLALFRLS